MSKKYLLYIHNDKFQKEPHKSALVNRLLGEHYSEGAPETPPNEGVVSIGLDGVCKGHPSGIRMNCGLKGCKYA